MSSRITLQVSFSFKGETYHPACELDLDAVMASHGELPDFHHLIAEAAQIDSYSYLYEVLCAHEIEYRNASGLATQFLHDGQFDINAFQQAWHRQRLEQDLAKLATRYLGAEALTAQPQLLPALHAAWELGRRSRD